MRLRWFYWRIPPKICRIKNGKSTQSLPENQKRNASQPVYELSNSDTKVSKDSTQKTKVQTVCLMQLDVKVINKILNQVQEHTKRGKYSDQVELIPGMQDLFTLQRSTNEIYNVII